MNRLRISFLFFLIFRLPYCLFAQGDFASKVDYGTGFYPYSVFASDLDGDGDKDLAVANANSNTVSVLKNNGDGAFAAKVDYATGSSPTSVLAVDLDGDGDKDLAVANVNSNTVSVFKNNGNGTFATKVDYATFSPTSVFASDLDGDADLDLAVTDNFFHKVSILKNNGNGTFATKIDYETGENPQSVFAADLDGDGDKDLAVANTNSSTVSVLKNNGNGTFAAKVDYATEAGPFSVFVSDLDGDGDQDLAVANSGSYTVSIFKNNGNGTFATKVDYATGIGPLSVFASDLDGDNDQDLAVANSGSYTVSIFKNNGNGTFATKVDFPAGMVPRSVFVSDLDGDGDQDLTVVNGGSNTVSVLKNNLFGGRFRPNVHGWQFSNNESNMWPYSHGLNCFGEDVIWCWDRFRCEDVFPSWELFAEAFGDNQVYTDLTNKIKRPFALSKWNELKECWGGSCFGFAISGLLYFNKNLSLANTFPGYTNVYSVPINNDSRKLVNKYYLYQFGKEHQAHINANWQESPTQTLNDLQQMIVTEKKNDRILVFYNQNPPGAHAVVACSLAQDNVNTNVYHVFIYDNNLPETDRILDINTLTNTWEYTNMLNPDGSNWGGNKGIFLMDPISTYLTLPTLPLKLPPKERYISSSTNLSNFMQIYNSSSNNIVIKNSSGAIIGYSDFDSTLIDSMPNASPIIPITGSLHPPIGYFLPKETYSVEVSNSTDSNFYFSIFTDSNAFDYERKDFFIGQSDNILYDHTKKQFQVKTGDVINKNANLKVISIETSAELVYDIQGLLLSQNDSIQLKIRDTSQLDFVNLGTAKTYTLVTELAKDSTNPIFTYPNINISGFSSHKISPDWSNPDSQMVTIFVDSNLDSIFDDTIKVQGCLAKAGDANGTGTVNLADIIALVNHVFKGAPKPNPACRGDANANGMINLADIIYEVNYIFKGGPAPIKSGVCCL